MKILFPTDFSNASQNAFIYALKLAEKLNAAITVLHVYEVLEAHTWIEEATNMKELNEKITIGEFERFREEIDVLKRIAVENKLDSIDVQYTLQENDHIVPAIVAEARATATGFIVMGTTGAHGIKEIFFGSIASKVMESASCPVFIVPDTASYRGIQKVGLIIESKSDGKKLIEQAIPLARAMQAHLACIHVNVYDPAAVKAKMDGYAAAYKDIPNMSFHTHHELDVEKGVLEYTRKHQMDVILLGVHHQHTWLNFFSSNLVKRVAYHSEIPLIALQG
jgi:nucleotide-binding universal stress UspA family protein